MTLKTFLNLSELLPETAEMPVLFLGHGSPMNAIEDNIFTRQWRQIAPQVPQPRAIVSISAHWETHGMRVVVNEQPQTIHDFYGFPRQLFDYEYNAPGYPRLAEAVSKDTGEKILLDDTWGIDHGTWSVLCHIYPEAAIPVIQISLDKRKTAEEHFELAQQLAALRKHGVLIVGSGNIVHNLRLMRPVDEDFNAEYGFDWNYEFMKWVNTNIDNRDFHQLAGFAEQGMAAKLSVPTAEHYLPMLYAAALATDADTITRFCERPIVGSLDMTSLWIGSRPLEIKL